MRRPADLPRAERNALADVIVRSLHERDARPPLAALSRVAESARPVVIEGAIAAQLRTRGLVAHAARAGASARGAPGGATTRSAHRSTVVLAAACVPFRDAIVARLRAAGVAADAYWRDAERTPHANERAAALARAVALFAAGLYFEVHEELEPVWRRTGGDARVALQGLIQIAVALHHAERGNDTGARRLLAAGRAKVSPYAPVWEGVAIDTLLADLRRWETVRFAGEENGPAPRLVLV